MLNNSLVSLTSNPFSFNVENDRKCSKMLLKRTHKKQLLCALLGKNSLISAFSPSFTLGDSVHLVAALVDRMSRERSNVCSSVIWPIMSSPPHKTSAFQPKTIQWIVEYPHAPVYLQSNWETPSPSKSDPAEIKRSYPHYNMIWTITSFTKQKFKVTNHYSFMLLETKYCLLSKFSQSPACLKTLGSPENNDIT